MKYVLAEFKKIKRNRVVYIVVFATVLVNIISVFQAGYGGNFSFLDYSDVLLWNHSCFLYPVMLTLLGGFLVDQEYKNDTLKNQFLIPVKMSVLVFAKLCTCFGILLLLVVFEFIFSIIVAVMLSIQMAEESVISFLTQQIIFAVCSFISILPVIILTVKKENGYLFGTFIAAFLEVCGIFLAPRKLCGYYSITAGLEILNFDGKMIGGSVISGNQGEITLFITFIISILLFFKLYIRTTIHS